MISKRLFLTCISAVILIAPACGPVKSGGNKTTRESYQENLTDYRPDFETDTKEEVIDEKIVEKDLRLEVSEDVTERLAVVSDTLRERRGENPVVQGFTVQVYAGSSRNAANDAKEKVYQTLQNVSPELEYVQPNFKVKVGQFIDRLEAQKMYAQLREQFPNALIIPEKISLR